MSNYYRRKSDQHPVDVDVDTNPHDSDGRQHFTLRWIDDHGKSCSQSFFDRLDEHVEVAH